MFKQMFGMKKVKILEEMVYRPLSGTLLKLEEVPDPTFSKKMLGEGVAIEPSEGRVSSPVDGVIIHVFPTKHAIGIRSDSGLEFLIHIGLETVNMKGEGFAVLVNEGERVQVGDPLIEFSLELIKKKASSCITPIVITNSEKIDSIEHISGLKNGKEVLFKVRVK